MNLAAKAREDLLAALAAVLPADALLTDPESLRPYECDGLSALRGMPLCVALPDTADAVAAVLATCHRFGVAVVPRGAGTGLSGGARPTAGAVLLSMARLRDMGEIDLANRTIRVGPGVRNLAISEKTRPHGFYYAPDPSSQIACSIGGNLAENSGGVHCLKYGLTTHNVLAAEMLDAHGQRLEIGSLAPDSPGYNLLSLLIGSEGLLGVVTSCQLRLLPVPEETVLLMAAFAEVARAADAVSAIIAAGIIPAGLEMMDRLAIAAAEDFVHVGYPRAAAAILLCELDGDAQEIAGDQERVETILREHGVTDLRLARDEATRLALWKGRKAAFPAVGRLAPDYYCMDGTIPRARLAEVLERIAELSREYGLQVANVFHAGDGNLHPLILYDANQEGQQERAERLGAEILALCVQVGGTITGEHGVGVEKLDSMCVQFSSEELAQLHRIKAAFDPEGRLNPGKAVPSLHRCAELGAMHVHGGVLPFPELERF
ncbi:MAG: FAD-linked oxidase C-terminal domain-containing protein [Acidithiobacillus sp.]|uniref:FAD-linked oxidase C-terminal domain-containing protein n=1 Tax=Acidithiobacillus sp. TaxID=1872118 RepID=UPI003CFDBA78